MSPSAILEKIEEKYQRIISDKQRIMDEKYELGHKNRIIMMEKNGLLSKLDVANRQSEDFQNKLNKFDGKIQHNLFKIFDNDHTYQSSADMANLSFHLEIVAKHPSRLLIKLVEGNPTAEFKPMLGVYKILARNGQVPPVFIHGTHNHQRLIFSTDDVCWKFQKNLKTIFTWKKEKNVFNEECWLKPNGIAILNFPEFTFHMISF